MPNRLIFKRTNRIPKIKVILHRIYCAETQERPLCPEHYACKRCWANAIHPAVLEPVVPSLYLLYLPVGWFVSSLSSQPGRSALSFPTPASWSCPTLPRSVLSYSGLLVVSLSAPLCPFLLWPPGRVPLCPGLHLFLVPMRSTGC